MKRPLLASTMRPTSRQPLDRRPCVCVSSSICHRPRLEDTFFQEKTPHSLESFRQEMSSPWDVSESEFFLTASTSGNDTSNFSSNQSVSNFSTEVREGYQFTLVSIATSVLLGVMTLTTIIGKGSIFELSYLIFNKIVE